MSGNAAIVVGVASSAGGISALRDLLMEAHCNKSLAFVLVPHLQRDYKTKLGSILSDFSELPTKTIENDMPIEACHVYLIPQNCWVEVAPGDRFKLIERPGKGTNQSGDVLLKSMARTYGRKAVGVVLSGSQAGRDGSAGVIEINNVGGITLAQDPNTAEFPAMPEEAINTGAVQHIYSASQIGKFLSSLSFEADLRRHEMSQN